MKIFVLAALICLPACSWFGARKHPLPDPTELIVTGAPAGASVFIDGSQAGRTTADRPQVLAVAPGPHKVEIKIDEKSVYREDTYVGAGERRVITVLSGSSR